MMAFQAFHAGELSAKSPCACGRAAEHVCEHSRAIQVKENVPRHRTGPFAVKRYRTGRHGMVVAHQYAVCGVSARSNSHGNGIAAAGVEGAQAYTRAALLATTTNETQGAT